MVDSPVQQVRQPRIQAGRAQQREPGPQVAIDWGEVVQNVHDRYTLVLGQYVQENAELAAALSSVQRRNAELEAKVAALTPAVGVANPPKE